ncbi:endonuclease/exonuclease/phosphatase [Desulfosarcina variabilis str. Montpellier]|uniref:endonuclease/exonuclease/phosphatase family protein n=1 Tax=Desulfosarcina variabilis TaxID=2300 RepID=UPI003AFAC353
MIIRFATYNIHRCMGIDGITSADRIATVLQQMDAHVIGLQEVAYDTRAPHNVLTDIARATQTEAIPGPTLLEHSGRYGNALLTRTMPEKIRRLNISCPGREPRGALIVSFQWDGVAVNVISTHLGLMPSERRRQMQRLRPFFLPPGSGITILMGDFNEWFRWALPLRLIRRRFGNQPAPLTFPSRRPLLALDRIWVHPADALVDLTPHVSPLSKIASDHLPLVADVDILCNFSC